MPRDSLVTIYKSFIRPHLDYADVIFNKPSNATFSNRIESAQNNAALAITRTIRGTYKEKLYQELGFETMKERRFRRICCFSKILNNQTTGYLYSLLSPPNRHYNTRKHSRLDRFSAEQKLLVILFCLRQLKNGTNLIPQSAKLLHIQHFAKHF